MRRGIVSKSKLWGALWKLREMNTVSIKRNGEVRIIRCDSIHKEVPKQQRRGHICD